MKGFALGLALKHRGERQLRNGLFTTVMTRVVSLIYERARDCWRHGNFDGP